MSTVANKLEEEGIRKMKLIRCKKCNAPLSLRSKDLGDAFTSQAQRLREKWSGKLKRGTTHSSDFCLECYEGDTKQ